MAISVDCSKCGKTLKAKDSAAGKTAKCPSCGEPILIPQASKVYDAEDEYGSSTGPAEDSSGVSAGDDLKACAMCGEMIAAAAKKCKFCGEIFDAKLKKSRKKSASSGEEMTTGDWVLCVICPGIGCIVGIVRAIQGKSMGGKMIGISIGFIILWNIISVIIQTAAQRQ